MDEFASGRGDSANPFSGFYHNTVVMTVDKLLRGCYEPAWERAGDNLWREKREAMIRATGSFRPGSLTLEDHEDIFGLQRVLTYAAAAQEATEPERPFVSEVLRSVAERILAATPRDEIAEAAAEIAEAMAQHMGAASAIADAWAKDNAQRRGIRRLLPSRKRGAARQEELARRGEEALDRLGDASQRHADRGTSIDALILLLEALQLEAEDREARGDEQGSVRIARMASELLDSIEDAVHQLEVIQERLIGDED